MPKKILGVEIYYLKAPNTFRLKIKKWKRKPRYLWRCTNGLTISLGYHRFCFQWGRKEKLTSNQALQNFNKALLDESESNLAEKFENTTLEEINKEIREVREERYNEKPS
jgi:hypothetical protein